MRQIESTMPKQAKLDQYFQQAPNKNEMGTTQQEKHRKCDECLNITLEQFSECTNIKDLIAADMREKMPEKFQRKLHLVDKYVKQVYDKYISDLRYRKKPLFKNLVFDPKPWLTKRDRELLKQHGVNKCYVNMYDKNVLKFLADRYLQNAIKNHGEEMSEAVIEALPMTLQEIFDKYIAKYKTLDNCLEQYGKYSRRIRRASNRAHNKFSESATGVAAGPSQNVAKNTKKLNSSNRSNCGEVSSQTSYLINISTSPQNNDNCEPIFLISADSCSTQKEVDRETPNTHNVAHAQEETSQEVGSSEILNPNGNSERSIVSVNNRNGFENNAEGHVHSNKLNWLEKEYGLNINKLSIKPLKKKLSEAIEMRIKQQFPNVIVIENREEVVNKTSKYVWGRITRSVEELQDVFEFVRIKSEPQGDFASESEIMSSVGNTEDLAAEVQEIFEELKENKNLPPPKMLNFNEFKEYTNIKEYLYNDIIEKFPLKTDHFLANIDKYVNKFYKSYILGSDNWPKGIFFKSKDLLKEFHEKHKPQKVKCEPDDIYRINTNASEVVPQSPFICGKSICTKKATTCLNRKRNHPYQRTNMKSDVNIEAYKKQDCNEVTGKQANSPNMHNAQIETVHILPYADSQTTNCDIGTVEKRAFENAPRNSPSSLLAVDSNNLQNQFELATSESSFNINIEDYKKQDCNEATGKQANSPNMHYAQIETVHILPYADSQTTNCDIGTAEKRAFEHAPRNSPCSEGATSESIFNIHKEIKKEPYVEVSRGNEIQESLNLSEEDNDVAFVSYKQPEFIYISDEPLSSSLLLEDMMRTPPKTDTHPYKLPARYPVFYAENKAETSRMEKTGNMNSLNNYTEQQAALSLHQNNLESSQNELDLLENNSDGLKNNEKDESCKINSNEINEKIYEKEQPKMDLCLESDQNSEKNENNTKMSNFRPTEEEIAIHDLKIKKFEEKDKTTEASDVKHAKTQRKEKKSKQNAKNLKKNDKRLRKIKQNIKIPTTDLSNDLVAQKAHSFRPLLLIKKSKEFQQDTAQKISAQEERGLNFLDDKYNIEDASLIGSITSEKRDTISTSTTVDLLSKDNSYFLSSQLSPKDPEPLKNAKSSLVLEHVEKNNKTAAEGTELATLGNHWEENFMKNVKIHIRSPSNRPFECITNLHLHQIILKSKINHLNYNSSTPFLQASRCEYIEAIITVLTSGFNQLRIVGPCLNFLFGITQGEWASFRQILGYLGVFTYNKKQLESEMEPLPYRVLYNFFKTIPSFSQVIFEYEDANINHVTCLKFNMKIQKPTINLEKVIDSYILNSIENLKNKFSS